MSLTCSLLARPSSPSCCPVLIDSVGSGFQEFSAFPRLVIFVSSCFPFSAPLGSISSIPSPINPKLDTQSDIFFIWTYNVHMNIIFNSIRNDITSWIESNDSLPRDVEFNRKHNPSFTLVKNRSSHFSKSLSHKLSY